MTRRTVMKLSKYFLPLFSLMLCHTLSPAAVIEVSPALALQRAVDSLDRDAAQKALEGGANIALKEGQFQGTMIHKLIAAAAKHPGKAAEASKLANFLLNKASEEDKLAAVLLTRNILGTSPLEDAANKKSSIHLRDVLERFKRKIPAEIQEQYDKSAKAINLRKDAAEDSSGNAYSGHLYRSMKGEEDIKNEKFVSGRYQETLDDYRDSSKG